MRKVTSISQDGDMYCVLTGPNLQEGQGYFGKTVEEAVEAYAEAQVARGARPAVTDGSPPAHSRTSMTIELTDEEANLMADILMDALYRAGEKYEGWREEEIGAAGSLPGVIRSVMAKMGKAALA
jgi:hypothetical protein